MANYIISGAGSGGNFNGTFEYYNIVTYRNSLDTSYVLFYDIIVSQWVIQQYSDVYYYNTSDDPLNVPLSGWLTFLGSAPAPTITLETTTTTTGEPTTPQPSTTTTTTTAPIPSPSTFFNFRNLFLKSSFDNNVSLYIKSTGYYFGARALYIEANTQEQTNLYVKSFPQNSINLFIKYWNEYQDNKELYLKAFVESSADLFIKNLYLYTDADGSIDFNIRSSTIDQQMNSVEIYIKSFFENNLELFLMVDDTALTTGFVYTYISGDTINPSHFESLNLYLSNEYASINESLSITIIGLGTTFNAIPDGSSMEMFIQRDVEATWNYMPLIAYGASSAITNSIDFNIYANDVCFDSIELVIPEVNQPFNETMQLYTHGFED
jgi:hypothetical protein